MSHELLRRREAPEVVWRLIVVDEVTGAAQVLRAQP
jgi:hypothetical protein